MARPERNTVDYFPHKIGDGKKIFSIEAKYGNDGYATWFKLLEKLATTENHYLDFNDDTESMYLSAKCKVSEDTLFNIIEDLTRLGVFDKLLWSKKYLWCESFIDSIKDVYIRRNNNCITYEGLCKHLSINCNTVIHDIAKKDDSNTQTKLNYTKLKDNVELQKATTTDNSSLNKPKTHDLFVDFFNYHKGLVTGTKGKFTATTKIVNTFKIRIVKYKNEKLKITIRNAFRDKTHIENSFKYVTPEFVLREEIIERYINIPEPTEDEINNLFEQA